MDQVKIRVGDPMGLRSKDLSKFHWADICPCQNTKLQFPIPPENTKRAGNLPDPILL